jgi:hypothetical protein
MCNYNHVMQIDWAEQKNRQNRVKHGVSFETAQHVFDDPHHLSIQDRYEDGEERWQTIGMIGGVVVLLVAHAHYEADGDEVIRIISARKATSFERRNYEDQR